MNESEKSIWDGFDFKDPKEAFEKAITEGRLSREEDQENFAGNYMYMHTTNGRDYFKNIITRKYDV